MLSSRFMSVFLLILLPMIICAFTSNEDLNQCSASFVAVQSRILFGICLPACLSSDGIRLFSLLP